MLASRSLRVLVGVTLALTPVSAVAAPGGGGAVAVVHLGVDGWQMIETRQARSHATWVPGTSTPLTPGTTFLRRTGNYDVYRVGAGTFEFSSTA